MSKITYIDEVEIKNKRVLLRVDYNVSLNKDGTIHDDTRIKNSLPTIEYLLERGNTLILMSHLGNPKGRDKKLSLKPIATRLQTYTPAYYVELINDFLTDDLFKVKEKLNMLSNNKTIYIIENTRFYPGEKKNDSEFAKKLAALADVYVNDGFGVCHRNDASVIGVPLLLPSYGGLLLKKEVSVITKGIEAPKKPLVVVAAGAKVSKIGFIKKLLQISDAVLIGGAMANIFLKAQGYEIGCGQFEPEFITAAKEVIEYANKNKKKLLLPTDYRVGNRNDEKTEGVIKKFSNMDANECPLDIGPETEIHYSAIIAQAKTLIWNGPVGYFENPQYALGTEAILKAIIDNTNAVSIIGGGDTLTSIKHSSVEGKITHISTGGGAMLELIEKGTLPGIEVLKR